MYSTWEARKVTIAMSVDNKNKNHFLPDKFTKCTLYSTHAYARILVYI